MTTYKKVSVPKILIITFVIVFILYSLFETSKIISGPKLEIKYPENGAQMATSTVLITGNAKNISFISLNERQIFTDTKGNFSEKIVLLSGYNPVVVSVKDKLGRSKTEIISIWNQNKKKELETETLDEATTTPEINANTSSTTEEISE